MRNTLRPTKCCLAVAAVLCAGAMAANVHAEEGDERYPGLDYDPTTVVPEVEHRVRAHKPVIQSADGRHRFGIRGRVMFDAQYNNFDDLDTVNRAEFGDEELAKYGTTFRRLRLGALGVMYDNWEWQAEFDFRDEEIRYGNIYMAYLMDRGRLAFGYFKEPWGLESHTSSRRISFMERAAAVDALRPNPSRAPGIMYETLVPGYYVGAGVFGGDGVSRNRDITEGYGTALRASFAPFEDAQAETYSHLGASLNWRRNGYGRGDDCTIDGESVKCYEPVRKRTRTGARAAEGRFVGRNDIEGVNYFTSVALEAAYGTGPFSIQGEYIVNEYNRPSNLKAEQFSGEFNEAEIDNLEWLDHYEESFTQDGWYVEGTYYLTGEHRNYRSFSGDFGPARVNNPWSAGGWGAWQVGLRYSTVDGTTDQFAVDADGDLVVGDDWMDGDEYGGGQELDQWTIGVNWWPERDIVFKFNAIYNDASYQTAVENDDDEPEVRETTGWVYALRAQYEW